MILARRTYSKNMLYAKINRHRIHYDTNIYMHIMPRPEDRAASHMTWSNPHEYLTLNIRTFNMPSFIRYM